MNGTELLGNIFGIALVLGIISSIFLIFQGLIRMFNLNIWELNIGIPILLTCIFMIILSMIMRDRGYV